MSLNIYLYVNFGLFVLNTVIPLFEIYEKDTGYTLPCGWSDNFLMLMHYHNLETKLEWRCVLTIVLYVRNARGKVCLLTDYSPWSRQKSIISLPTQEKRKIKSIEFVDEYFRQWKSNPPFSLNLKKFMLDFNCYQREYNAKENKDIF